MARVQLEALVDHFDSDMRAALADAVRELLPEARFDEGALLRAFRQALRRRSQAWERLPSRCLRV